MFRTAKNLFKVFSLLVLNYDLLLSALDFNLSCIIYFYIF